MKANSYYHALEVGIQHRMSHGFELQVPSLGARVLIPAPQPALATILELDWELAGTI